jgi:predicted Zn-dependent peptidase
MPAMISSRIALVGLCVLALLLGGCAGMESVPRMDTAPKAATTSELAAPISQVLPKILGGGMAGRFFSDLRDKQGLAYTTATQFSSRVDPSFFLGLLGTAPANVAKAEAALRGELEHIQREPVSDEELRVGQAYLLGNLEMDRRTNARQAWYLAFFEVAGVGYEFLDRYVARVPQITAAEVQGVARRYLSPLRAVIVEPPAK